MYKFRTLHLRLSQTRSCCLPKALDHSLGLEFRHTDRSRVLPYSFLFITELVWGKSPSLTTPLIPCDNSFKSWCVVAEPPFQTNDFSRVFNQAATPWHREDSCLLSYDTGLRAELFLYGRCDKRVARAVLEGDCRSKKVWTIKPNGAT